MQEVVLTQGTNSLHSEILFFCTPLLKECGGNSLFGPWSSLITGALEYPDHMGPGVP